MRPLLSDTELPAAGADPSRFWLAALAMTAAAILLFNLGDYRSFSSHEAYAAVPAREMLETGDWIVPHYGGLPRLQKPPLIYWIIATVSWPFGDVTHWTARLPQAVSAMALAGLIGWWGARWYGRLAGLGAAFAQITTVWVMIWGRKAEMDMLLCLLTTSALLLAVTSYDAEPRRRAFCRWLAFYGLLSLSWLAKFHYGPAMVLPPVVLWLLLERRTRTLRWLLHPVGLPLFVAALVVWPAMLLERVPHAPVVWQREIVARATGGISREPLWFYVPHLIWMTLPWLPLALAALPASVRRALGPAGDREGPVAEGSFVTRLWRRISTGDARERFLWIWPLAQLAVLSLSANKHKHYLIALLPVFSLLAGQSLVLVVERARRGKPLLTAAWATFWTLALAVIAAVLSLLAQRKWPLVAGPTLVVCLVLAIGGTTALWLVYGRRWKPAILAGLAVLLACHFGVNGWILPLQDRRAPVARFAEEVRRAATPAGRVDVFGLEMHPVVFYLDGPVQRFEETGKLAEQLDRRRTLRIITDPQRLPELQSLGELQILKNLSDPSGRTPGLAFVRLTKRTDLALHAK